MDRRYKFYYAKYKNNRGFTLIEIMMGTAVLGVFLLVVYNFLGFNIKYQNEYSGDADSYSEARIAMDRISFLLSRYEVISLAPDPGAVAEGVIYEKRPNPDVEGSFLYIPLINFFANTDKDQTEVAKYKYYYYLPAGNVYGQILNSEGNIVADGIIRFDFIRGDQDPQLNPVDLNPQSFVNIYIDAVPVLKPEEAIPLSLSTSLRLERKYYIDFIE
ncbi:MAG: prepilin-type N-terminal cleavage/methylation domain-containing protein [Peptococcaceae bacterium]|nr:prepilin-type N-terminal cleavage/methylation domain-containing protein [Peptococcaceae bacterium]